MVKQEVVSQTFQFHSIYYWNEYSTWIFTRLDVKQLYMCIEVDVHLDYQFKSYSMESWNGVLQSQSIAGMY